MPLSPALVTGTGYHGQGASPNHGRFRLERQREKAEIYPGLTLAMDVPAIIWD
jgi:hypothetical protein